MGIMRGWGRKGKNTNRFFPNDFDATISFETLKTREHNTTSIDQGGMIVNGQTNMKGTEKKKLIKIFLK